MVDSDFGRIGSCCGNVQESDPCTDGSVKAVFAPSGTERLRSARACVPNYFAVLSLDYPLRRRRCRGVFRQNLQ